MTFRAACIQLCSSGDPAENVATVRDVASRAAAEGAAYVQTPEMTSILQRDRNALMERIGTEEEDASVAAFAALAAELGIVLHIGSLALKTGDGRIANRSIVFGPDGSVLARYDKIHLFDVDLPNGESWRESAVYAPGESAVAVDLPFARLGLTICYDLRFPHLYRALAHAGAEVIATPAAFTRQTGEAHWHVLQRARAIENGAFIIAAAQGGRHSDGRSTYGHSLIVAPWGEILAEAGAEGPDLIVADIDTTRVRDARARIPSLRNERPFAAPAAGISEAAE